MPYHARNNSGERAEAVESITLPSEPYDQGPLISVVMEREFQRQLLIFSDLSNLFEYDMGISMLPSRMEDRKGVEHRKV